MNERIKQLAEQAGIQLPDDTAYNGHIFTQSIERLAQLLEKDAEAKYFSAGYTAGHSDGITETVQQCLVLCDQVDLAGADDCIDNIRQHYGVEE